MLRILSLIMVFSLSSAALIYGQSKYPVEIMPNETKTFTPEKDTLWVLTNRQVKRAITDAKQLKLELESSNLLKEKIGLMQAQSLTKDSLVVDLKKDRDYYMNNWNQCNKDVDILIKKNKRQRLFTRLSFAGIVVAFVAGFLIGK